MSGRDFQFFKKFAEGRPQSGFRIICGECRATAEFIQAGGERKPAIAAEQHFRKQGWFIGARERGDRCPACMAAQTVARRERQDQRKQEAPVTTQAEAPREMERDDRRVIFAKLNDVYLDATKGYDAGWTDHRVSVDLGVPEAWVAALREENFGPCRDNADLRAFLEKAEQAANDLARIEGGFKQFSEALDLMREQVRGISKLAATVQSQVRR